MHGDASVEVRNIDLVVVGVTCVDLYGPVLVDQCRLEQQAIVDPFHWLHKDLTRTFGRGDRELQP
ncbi:hypothetical protein D3C80_1950120 [compost metagenome]